MLMAGTSDALFLLPLDLYQVGYCLLIHARDCFYRPHVSQHSVRVRIARAPVLVYRGWQCVLTNQTICPVFHRLLQIHFQELARLDLYLYHASDLRAIIEHMGPRVC